MTLTTDVLVVGAGPSGLMAAQALGRLGIDVIVVEKRAPGEAYGNADGLQPRTLEIWKSYGILETIASKGAYMIGMVGYEAADEGRSLVRSQPINNVVVSTRYPYEITASISDIEGTLRKKAEKANVRFLYQCCPISIKMPGGCKKSGVSSPLIKIAIQVAASEKRKSEDFCAESVAASPNNGTDDIIYAKYVIGADGAYSWVRRAMEIKMEGEQAEDVWGVIDVLMDTDFPDLRLKCIIQKPQGPLIIIPREKDKVRIYVLMAAIDKVPRREDGRIDKSAFHSEERERKVLRHVYDRLAPYHVKITKVFWSTIFAISQKVASSFSIDNTIFIAGDACHTHSPKAGQGANASMGDTHNLAWKLVHVLKGWASPSLLSTYEHERRQYALDLVMFDKEISASLECRAAADYQRILHKQNLFTSGLGISYNSSLTVLSKKYGQVSSGERFPFAPIHRIADWKAIDIQDLLVSDGKFKLILLPGSLKDPSTQSTLKDFAFAFRQAIDTGGKKSQVFRHMLIVYTVAGDSKEEVTWKLVPSALAESWRCCFTARICESEELGVDIYKQFGIIRTASADFGIAVLVRPDGYISIIRGLQKADAVSIVSFLDTL